MTDPREPHVTTVRLPEEIYGEAWNLIESGLAEVHSFNDLMVSALKRHLDHLRREQVAAKFDQMARDEAYQSFATGLQKKFEYSDWEALPNLSDAVQTLEQATEFIGEVAKEDKDEEPPSSASFSASSSHD